MRLVLTSPGRRVNAPAPWRPASMRGTRRSSWTTSARTITSRRPTASTSLDVALESDIHAGLRLPRPHCVAAAKDWTFGLVVPQRGDGEGRTMGTRRSRRSRPGTALLDVTVAPRAGAADRRASRPQLVVPGLPVGGARLDMGRPAGRTRPTSIVDPVVGVREAAAHVREGHLALNTAIDRELRRPVSRSAWAPSTGWPTWTYRLGYYFDSRRCAGESVTPLLPDANRHGVTLGLGHDARPVDGSTLYNLFLFVEKRSTEGRRAGRLRRHVQVLRQRRSGANLAYHW